MANRSTRNKIKWQAKQCLSKLDDVLVHLQNIDNLSAGECDSINKMLPLCVTIITETRARLQDVFRFL